MSTTDLLRLARVDLACYAMVVSSKFELAPHHRQIVELLEAVERGDLDRAMICAPPRHGKSMLTSVNISGVLFGAPS